MAGQGEPHQPRLFTPAVAVVVGYVLLVGNPWLNQELTLAVSDVESAIRLTNVLFSYPRWHVDVDRVGPFLFWFANLRTVLFVALAVAGLPRVSRWVSDSAGGLGRFVTTVGVTTLSAVTAGLASALVAVTVLTTDDSLPFIDGDRPEEFFLGQLGSSATFGVVFGVVLAALAAGQSRAPTEEERRATPPKSFW